MDAPLSPPSDPLRSPVPLLRTEEISHPERALQRGELATVRRGVVAPGPLWRRLEPWERYAARVHAVHLVAPGTVFSHESAAVLLGLPVFGDPGIVHVIQDIGGTARVSAGIRTHTSADIEIIDLGGLAATSPASTAVAMARARQEAIGLANADAALRMDGALTAEQLVAANESRASARGRRHARWALHRASADPESTLESLSRAVIEWLGFPDPVLQHWLTSRQGERDRVDMWWPEDRIAGEADGDLKYDGRFGDPAELMRSRRRRDARLREHARAVPHWAWGDAVAATPLRSILLGSGLRRIRPEDSGRLFSLRTALASPVDPARLQRAAETAGITRGFGSPLQSR